MDEKFFDDLPRVKAFGVWDAPITDDAIWLDEVPTDMRCWVCQENFQEGDNGAIMSTGFAQHRECSLRSVFGGIGHLVDHEYFCKGPLGTDAGLSTRASALMVWNFHHNNIRVTRESLLLLSGHAPEPAD